VPVREGLERLDGVESISQRPDLRTATCELRMKNGRLLDPQRLSKFISDIRVGARLRGLEARVNGLLEKQGEGFLLRLAGSDELLHLAPLGRKVQQDTAKKRPSSSTRSERKACERLLARWRGKPISVQVTGPLLKSDRGVLILQVRRFERI
jgi:hypothetical protein